MARVRRHALLVLSLAATLASVGALADEGPAPDAATMAKPAASANPFGALDLSIAPQEGRSLDDGRPAAAPPTPVAPVETSPAPTIAAPQAAAPEPDVVARQPTPAAAPSAEAGKLKARAQTALENGDIAGARALLVAAGRDPEAERLLAEAWDPDVLSRLGVIGVAGDAAKAKTYYDQANADGASGDRPPR